MENRNLSRHAEETAAEKDILLKRMLEEAGFADDEGTGAFGVSGRSRQLQNFLAAIDEGAARMPSEERSAKTVEDSGSLAKRTLSNLDIFQKAYDDTAKVVFTGNVMCPEILFAANLVPFNTEVLSAFLANSHAAQKFLDVAERNHFTRDMCAVVRCVLGAAMENCLPVPDFLAFASCPCDSSSKMFYALSRIYEKEYFMLDIPYRNTGESLSHLAGRIRAMGARIEDALGIKISPDRLDAAVSLSKEAISRCEKLFALYRSKNIILPFAKSMDDTISAVSLLGSEDVIGMIEAAYAETARWKNDSPEKRAKVVWQGMRPFYSDEIVNYLEDTCHIDIILGSVLGPMETGVLLGTDDPYLYMARRLIAFSGGDDIQYAAEISDLMESSGTDGIILFNQWGCRHMLSTNQILRDALARKNIPVLEIDGDFIDSGNYSFSQIQVRIDAFAEILQRRRP